MNRTNYLLRFRRAKRTTTLELMFERLIAKADTTKAKADIMLAKCQRERELEQNRLLNR